MQTAYNLLLAYKKNAINICKLFAIYFVDYNKHCTKFLYIMYIETMQLKKHGKQHFLLLSFVFISYNFCKIHSFLKHETAITSD